MSNKSTNNDQQLPTLHQLLSQQEFAPEEHTPTVTPVVPVMESSEGDSKVSANKNKKNVDYVSSGNDGEKQGFIRQWARRKALLDYYKIEK